MYDTFELNNCSEWLMGSTKKEPLFIGDSKNGLAMTQIV
jgi:hypothetical protein